jgi:transposase
MISFQGDTRIFIALGPTDMRKGFDALAAIVAHSLKLDPLSGQLFLFFNRRRDKMKILYWDRDGLAIWYRRLEQGTYQVPQADPTSHSVEARAEKLLMILRGIEYQNAERRKRFSLTAKVAHDASWLRHASLKFCKKVDL